MQDIKKGINSTHNRRQLSFMAPVKRFAGRGNGGGAEYLEQLEGTAGALVPQQVRDVMGRHMPEPPPGKKHNQTQSLRQIISNSKNVLQKLLPSFFQVK
jgi:hypothetical protein